MHARRCTVYRQPTSYQFVVSAAVTVYIKLYHKRRENNTLEKKNSFSIRVTHEIQQICSEMTVLCPIYQNPCPHAKMLVCFAINEHALQTHFALFLFMIILFIVVERNCRANELEKMICKLIIALPRTSCSVFVQFMLFRA